MCNCNEMSSELEEFEELVDAVYKGDEDSRTLMQRIVEAGNAVDFREVLANLNAPAWVIDVLAHSSGYEEDGEDEYDCYHCCDDEFHCDRCCDEDDEDEDDDCSDDDEGWDLGL